MNDHFKEKLKESGMSMYRLSKTSGVSYTLINELCNDKTWIDKKPVDLVLKLSLVLGCPVEDLLDPFPFMDNRSGRYKNVSYVWKYDNGKMKLHIRHRGESRIIESPYKMLLPAKVETYNAAACFYIDEYLDNKQFEKEVEKKRHA